MFPLTRTVVLELQETGLRRRCCGSRAECDGCHCLIVRTGKAAAKLEAGGRGARRRVITPLMPSGRQGSIHLFKFAGVDVFLHWSWFLIAVIEIQSHVGRYSSVAWNVFEYLAL